MQEKTNMSARKRNRLKDFDYSLIGDYSITICTNNRKKLFWIEDYMCYQSCVESYSQLLTPLGKMVCAEIEKTSEKYNNRVVVEKYVVMPDHIHMIVSINNANEENGCCLTIPRIVNQLKRSVTIKSNIKGIWQRSYYDHIIRNEKDYDEEWDYIDANPRKLTGNVQLKCL